MEQSMFIEWVRKWFGPTVVSVVEKLNGTENPLTYLHRTMLTREFSVTGKWESISVQNSLVAADIVAMDSPLPLKTRDTLAKYNGEICKVGMRLQLNERQLSDLDILKLQSGSNAILLQKLFQDTPRVIGGVWEILEAIFLQALSTGVAAVEDLDNVGTAIRVDYGIPTANRFGVGVLWSNPSTAKPLDDIQELRKKVRADGKTIGKVMIDPTARDNMMATDQIRGAYANSVGNFGNNLYDIDFDQLNSLMRKKFGFIFELVDRSVVRERDGVRTTFTPWADGQVVFLPGQIVGSLFWTRVAEMNHPVGGVEYQIADENILVSKYRTNTPALGEWTSSQGRILPVLTNTDSIYILDTKTVTA